MAVLKVIEILANSPESFEGAVQNAVREASKTIKNIRSCYINEQSCQVENGEVTEYRVNVKISFEVK
jgi:flavin-binding protein dodecin